MAQFEFVFWLLQWYLESETFAFDWDEWNSLKNWLKHGVETEDIEAVFTSRRAALIGKQVFPEIAEERLCVIGPGKTEKILSIVFVMRGQKVRVVSARPASRKERKIYAQGS